MSITAGPSRSSRSAGQPSPGRNCVRDGALRQVAADPLVAQLLRRLLLDRHSPVAHASPSSCRGGHARVRGARVPGAATREVARSGRHGRHALPIDARRRGSHHPRRRSRHPARSPGRRPVGPPVVGPPADRGAGGDHGRTPRVLPGRRAGRHDRQLPGHVRGFRGARNRPGAADALLRRSVDLALAARSRHVAECLAAGSPEPWPLFVAASVGPYGAMLADGSEYRGRYGRTVARAARLPP